MSFHILFAMVDKHPIIKLWISLTKITATNVMKQYFLIELPGHVRKAAERFCKIFYDKEVLQLRHTRLCSWACASCTTTPFTDGVCSTKWCRSAHVRAIHYDIGICGSGPLHTTEKFVAHIINC